MELLMNQLELREGSAGSGEARDCAGIEILLSFYITAYWARLQ